MPTAYQWEPQIQKDSHTGITAWASNEAKLEKLLEATQKHFTSGPKNNTLYWCFSLKTSLKELI